MQEEGPVATDSLVFARATEGRPDPLDHEAREIRFRELMRVWWLDERPGWTESDWWDASMRDDVRCLLWLQAGPQLAGALGAIGRLQSCVGPHADEPSGPTPTPGRSPGWPCACMVVLAAAWEACGAWASAGASCALVDCAGQAEVVFRVPELGLRVSDPAREELASALRTSLGSMANRIAGARDLVAHPRLVELVSSATISAWSARLIVREVEDLTDEQATAVVGDVCDRVRKRRDEGRRSWTSAEIGRAARRARLRVCPDADQEARQRAFARRRVQVLPDRHGMATIVADLDATDAHRIHRRLTAIASGLADPADARTRDQVRADVLVDILLGAARGCSPRSSEGESGAAGGSGAGGTGSAASGSGAELVESCMGRPTDGCQCVNQPSAGARPEISVVMSLSDILGMTDDPAHVPGLGPIPADLARTLAADSTWRAWITDASGAVAATGTRSYVPTAAIARLVRAREPVCRMPGCRQSASNCDLDHTVAYPAGPTTAANLGPLCRRHHVLKTHVGWSLIPAPDTTHGFGGPVDRAESSGTDPGLDPPRPVAWSWRTPAGFTIREHPDPPHQRGS